MKSVRTGTDDKRLVKGGSFYVDLETSAPLTNSWTPPVAPFTARLFVTSSLYTTIRGGGFGAFIQAVINHMY